MTGLFGSLGTANPGHDRQSSSVANQQPQHCKYQYRRLLKTTRSTLKAEASYHLAGVGSIGMGVKVGSVERIVDDFCHWTSTQCQFYLYILRTKSGHIRTAGKFNEWRF